MNLLTRCMSVLNDDEMEQIYQAGLRVWARVPLRAQGTEEFMQAARDFGCEIDGERISFPEAVREKVLAEIGTYRHANWPPRRREVGSDRIEKNVSGQALYCCDLETDKLRPATRQDQEQFSWIVDSIPNLGRAHPTFIPQDVPQQARDLFTFAIIALNSVHPWRVSVYNADMIPYFLRVQAVCQGGDLEAARAKPIFATKCWVNTPFMITRENIEIGMRARELLGQPLHFSTMPVAGVATPVTLAGSLTLITAECLALNALAMALDGRPCGWTAGPLTFDMRTGVHTENSADVALLRLGSAQMGAYVFGGQWTGVGGPTTSSKQPDVQAAMDKALDTMWAVCAGVRSFGSLATLADADIGSLTQLMVDLELMGYFERLVQGIAVDDDRLAEEVIAEVAPRGAYFLNHDHTAKYFREELWLPELIDRRVPMAWAQDPRTMVDNARAKARQVAASAENQCPLSDEQRREIEGIMAEAAAKATA
jgi:trimethylamine--corrinoid protein Co-methyltransferase